MTLAAWPAETRQIALEMRAQGMTCEQVSAELGIAVHTIYDWSRRQWRGLVKTAPKPRPKASGSGVIAPAPYARGYVFPGGSGRRRGE